MIDLCDAQIENEYGFCGFNDKAYLQHLVDTARASLGDEAVLFTTDPPNVVTMGGLYGDDVISCVHIHLANSTFHPPHTKYRTFYFCCPHESWCFARPGRCFIELLEQMHPECC